jgi:hypothetical protein
MTRPFLRDHSSISGPVKYATRTEAGLEVDFVGGTLVWNGLPQVQNMLKNIIGERPTDNPILHMTISMPKGVTPSLSRWREGIKIALSEIGLPPLQIPWLAWRHSNVSGDGCDHAHIVATKFTFSGRPIILKNRKQLCENADRALRHFFGFALPSALKLELPKRRLNTPNANFIATSIEKITACTTIATVEDFKRDLDAEGVSLEVTPNKYGTPSFVFNTKGGSEPGLRGGRLSNDLTPKSFSTWLIKNQNIAQAKSKILLSRLAQRLSPQQVSSLPSAPSLKGQLDAEQLTNANLAGRNPAPPGGEHRTKSKDQSSDLGTPANDGGVSRQDKAWVYDPNVINNISDPIARSAPRGTQRDFRTRAAL